MTAVCKTEMELHDAIGIMQQIVVSLKATSVSLKWKEHL